jgi:hypothetical protein
MIRIILSSLLGLVFLIPGLSESAGQILNDANPAEVCKSAPPLTSRKTIVYVDVASVRKENPQWGYTILNKLELAPRESLSIISVNPTTFEIKEAFDLCYPKLTESELVKERTSRSMWEKLTRSDPVDQQKENLKIFETRVRIALNGVEGESGKYKEGARRNILGAISLDKNRYAERGVFYRVILYTDGGIKDAGLDDKKSDTVQTGTSLAEKYSASFSGAEVAIFGIDNADQNAVADPKEKQFTSFFLKSWARLKSFSPSLPQQENVLYLPAIRMNGTFEGIDGTSGSAKVALFSAAQRDMVEGWLVFDVGREVLYVPYQGSYRCEANACDLIAVASESVPPYTSTPYFRKGDKIALKKNSAGGLEGSIQADPREKFDNGRSNIKYDLKFSAR